jgi:hypothetical protein
MTRGLSKLTGKEWARREMSRRKQNKNESLNEYALALKDLVVKAFPDIPLPAGTNALAQENALRIFQDEIARDHFRAGVFSEIKEKLLFMETKATLQETVMQAKGIQEICHDLQQESVFGIEKEMLANVRADVFALKQMIEDRNAESPNSPEYQYFDEENQDFDDDFQSNYYENQQDEMDCTPPHNGNTDSSQNGNWNREECQEFYSQESNFYAQPQRTNEEDCSYNPYCCPMENNERNANVNAVNQQTNRSPSVSLFLPFMTILTLTHIIGIFGHDPIFSNITNGILDEIPKAKPCMYSKNPLIQNNITLNIPNRFPIIEHTACLIPIFLALIIALFATLLWKFHIFVINNTFAMHNKNNNLAANNKEAKAPALDELIHKETLILDYFPSFSTHQKYTPNLIDMSIDKNNSGFALEIKFPSAKGRNKSNIHARLLVQPLPL